MASGNQALGGVSYLAFLAPGLLAAACMQSAAFEAAFPIMAGLEWTRVFHAMHATPINGRDIALGNLAWIAARMLLVAAIFTLIIVLFGAAASPLVVLAIPVAALTGLAFAAPIMAFVGDPADAGEVQRDLPLRDHAAVPVLRHVLSGRVAADLPAAAGLGHAAVARGGAVTRRCRWGRSARIRWSDLIHLAVLVGFIVVGTYASIRTVNAKLLRG